MSTLYSTLDRMLWEVLVKRLDRHGITPNRITAVRLILMIFVPILLWFGQSWWALGVFVFAAMTDFIDGCLARNTDQITSLGKILDPIADKSLVLLTLIGICATADSLVWVWWLCFGIMLAFEVSLAVIRLPMRRSARGTDTSARWWGKVKMVIQCVSLVMIMTPLLPAVWDMWLMVAMATVTAISGTANLKHFVGMWRRELPMLR